MGFEGLLRKYKISKISDNCLSDKELKICEHLNTLLGLVEYRLSDKNSIFFINPDSNKCVMEYTELKNLYVEYSFWNILTDLEIEESDIRSLINSWVDCYDLDIKYINHPIGLVSKLAEDFYKKRIW